MRLYERQFTKPSKGDGPPSLSPISSKDPLTELVLNASRRGRRASKVLLSDLYIQTKGEEDELPRLCRLEPNEVQAEYLDEVVPDWREGVISPWGLREIILKSRQMGFSTIILGLIFLATVNSADINSVIIADDADNTEMLFQKMRVFWEMLPAEKKPRTRYNSRRELYFHEIRSRITVLTAGKETSGRSRTIHFLLCSEVAFWPHPDILTGLLQCVPPDGGCIWLESTANGEAGKGATFCEMYRDARDNPTTTDYTSRFYPWWGFDAYERDAPDDFDPDEVERGISTKFDLPGLYGDEKTKSKLAWRRAKRAEPGMGNKFMQEYPGDDEEAFRVSGSRFFTEWNPSIHVILLSEVVIEKHWTFFGMLDWGYAKPFCFILGCVDERGRVIFIDEEYHTRLIDEDQAARVAECLARWGLKMSEIPIYGDPSMWAEKTDWAGRAVANVRAFLAKGLRMVRAVNDRLFGWSNFRRYLHDRDTDEKRTPFFRVLAGKCPNFIRCMPLMIHHHLKPEDAETDSDLVEDHAPDAGRYGLASRPRPAKDPKAEKDGKKTAVEGGEPRWLTQAKKRARAKKQSKF